MYFLSSHNFSQPALCRKSLSRALISTHFHIDGFLPRGKALLAVIARPGGMPALHEIARPPALLPLNETRGPQVGMAGVGGPWRTCCCALPCGQGEVRAAPASFAHQNESRQSDQTSPSTRPMQYAGNLTMTARLTTILFPGFTTQTGPQNSARPSCRGDCRNAGVGATHLPHHLRLLWTFKINSGLGSLRRGAARPRSLIRCKRRAFAIRPSDHHKTDHLNFSARLPFFAIHFSPNQERR